MWDTFNKVSDKDQPHTAISILKEIERKAVIEQNEGQLLGSLLMQYQMRAAISADSAGITLRFVDETAQKKTEPAEHALWKAAAGMVRLSSYAADTTQTSHGRKLLFEALADMAVLGRAKPEDYLPLFVVGKDSKLYNHDLLSVIGNYVLNSDYFTTEERQGLADKLINFYDKAGNRPATLLIKLSRFTLDYSADKKVLEHIAAEYQDLPLNVETYILLASGGGRTGIYISQDGESEDSLRLFYARKGLQLYGREKRAEELRNVIKRMEQPYIQFHTDRRTIYPGKNISGILSGKNVRKATLRFFRLNLTAADNRLIDFERDKVKSMLKRPTLTVEHDFDAAPAYRLQADTLSFSLDETGVYMVELSADGKRMETEIVYVSRVFPLILAARDGITRIRLLDAESGEPLQNGLITQYEQRENKQAQLKVYTADENNEIVLRLDQTGRYYSHYYASVGTDAYSSSFYLPFLGKGRQERERGRTSVDLFTDRAIYRPGQTVQFSGVAYTQAGDSINVVKNYEIKVGLYDANSQIVEDVLLRTDEMGVLSGEFKLPDICLPGNFRLMADKGQGSMNFKVEEYKRPTFSVEMEALTAAYKIGDTIQVSGVVKSYSGVPLPGCRVKYMVSGENAYYRLRNNSISSQYGDVVTDSLGRFRLSVFLDKPGGDSFNYMRYSVSVDVTAENGETVATSKTVHAGKVSAWLTSDWEYSFCKERIGRVTVSKMAVSGENLKGTITYTIYNEGQDLVGQGASQSGESFIPELLKSLPSGHYEVVFTTDETEELRQDFLVFSEYDTKPTGNSIFWQYVRQSEQRDSALVVIGSSCKDVTLFYSLFNANRRLEERIITFSDSLLRFPLSYRPEMGDGAHATFAFVKEGNIYTVGTEIVRPNPEKRLILSWSSFRSRLTPGQEETWLLRITHPDGTPADASLMARLYDASLDAFATSSWGFDYYFKRNTGTVLNMGPSIHSLMLSAYSPIKTKKVPALDFTSWNRKFFLPHTVNYYNMPSGGKVWLRSADAVYPLMAKRNNAGSADMMQLDEAVPASLESSQTLTGTFGVREEGDVPDNVVPRSNFAETAFFSPALRTDKEGCVTLSFILPESLTSWNFTALAHSRTMEYGRLDTTVVARKDFMVQAAMPRFVRQGDCAVIPVSLRNLTEKDIKNGKLLCELIDPETNKTVRRLSQVFGIPANKTATAHFDFIATYEQPVLICRVTADAGHFSDGEEHYLPVLSDRVSLSRSIPFSMKESGTLHLRLDTLWTDVKLAADRRLTVELSSNPVWYAIAALPALATLRGESAIDWALRYYSVELSAHIAKTNPEMSKLFADGETDSWSNVLARHPELKQTLLAESPWVAEAKTEAQRMAALRQLFNIQAIAAHKFTALDHLQALQQADGSWSWYRGMPGNTFITAEVALLLSRLNAIGADEEAQDMLRKAMDYLASQMERDVAVMKKNSRSSGIGETHLRYLYIRALQGLSPDATCKYLIMQALERPKDFTMYGKSLLAVVLKKAGRENEAAEVLKSLTEYTVSSPEMGRSFDTKYAYSSRRSYRIPTQTATIEALCAMPTAENLKMAEEMRLWLMQTKRTQMWETGRATADAVHALLQGEDGGIASVRDTVPPLLYTLKHKNKIMAFNAPSEANGRETLGYYHNIYTDAATLSATDITIRKQQDGLAWGSVIAQYTLPSAAVEKSDNGLALTRRLEVRQGNKWQPLDEGKTLKVGDVVRQVFTLTADRDYDFVVLKSARSANLSPRRPLSGYVWENGIGAYRAVRDTSTDYFMEKLSKGTFIVTEEYTCDRAGQYQCGICTFSSVYAPEFSAQTPGFVMLAE